MTTPPAAAVRRGAARAAPSPGWWASFQDEAISFFKGDNNAPWAILVETAIGCVPILGQLVDARDIIKGLVEVSSAPSNPMAWFNLITALIGLVPGGGDAAKRSLRAVKAGTTSVDDLLAMIRRLYKGDPEALLRKVLDVSTLRSKLDEILTNPRLLRQLPADMRRQVDEIRQGLGKQFDHFKKEVDGWLAKGRKTSADTGASTQARRRTGTPETKPHSQVGEGRSNAKSGGNSAQPRQSNAATQRTARFKQIAQKFLGVLGEHMADYHCQEIKGWGNKALHDQKEMNTAKLNDKGEMMQLWPCLPRGRGIDAVWKTTGSAKPYAIIEAKASYDPTKSLSQLLKDAWDKNEKGTSNSGGLNRRGSASGGGKSQFGTSAIRQTNGKVTQMGHSWIKNRIEKALGPNLQDLDVFTKLRTAAYTRHVLFFSIPQAEPHAEALILNIALKAVSATTHAQHSATREWTDAAIDNVVNDRAGITGKGRNKK